GIPAWRTSSPRARSASTAPPSRGSFSPAKTPAYSRLMAVASFRKCRTTIQPEPAESPTRSSTSSTTSTGANRRSPRLRTRHEALAAEVGHERRWEHHRAVGLLVVLEQRDDRPREGHAGGVQRVHELRLGARLAPEADPGPPRLEVGEGARARGLEPAAHPGGPHLEV